VFCLSKSLKVHIQLKKKKNLTDDYMLFEFYYHYKKKIELEYICLRVNDNLPAEAFINNCSALFLHHLFDLCFRFQTIPDVWNKIVINPVYDKLYCNILNERLAQWVDDNNLLADEQNGFRKGRSTIDQLFTLTKTPFTLANLDRSWVRSVLKRSILGKCKRLKSIFNRT
jgi:hypothetical protein